MFAAKMSWIAPLNAGQCSVLDPGALVLCRGYFSNHVPDCLVEIASRWAYETVEDKNHILCQRMNLIFSTWNYITSKR